MGRLDQAVSRGPETPHSELALKEVVQFGPVAIAYGTWGEPLTPQQIYGAAGLETPARIADNGFPSGYHSPLDYDITTEKAQQELADHAVEVGLAALEARGWKQNTSIRLYFGSTSAQPETTKKVVAKLEEHGVSVVGAAGRGFACASGVVALVDSCLDPSNHGVPTLILCAESLSGKAASDPGFRSTFSNGASALAFVPGDEVEVLAQQVIIGDDYKDSIRLPALAEYPPHDPSFIPGHYRVAPIAKIHSSVLGIWQEFHRTESDKAEWMPLAMGRLFKSELPGPVLAVLREYIEKYGVKNLQTVVLAHQANKGMVESIINRPKEGRGSVNDLLKRNKILDASGEPLQVNAPWVMDGLGISNVSSATTFIALAELAKNGAFIPSEDAEAGPVHVAITPDKDLMFVAYGIGYSIVPVIIRINS